MSLGPTLFWGAGIIVFPLVLFDTAISCTGFGGKLRPTADHYSEKNE
jgi:hypothetical protein